MSDPDRNHFLKKQWAFGIEELILAVIIILNILDFFEAIDPVWDYVKKIISWVILGYLLYKTSITNILFGTKHTDTDFLIVFSYFLFIIKDFTHYATVALEEGVHFLVPYYSIIVKYAAVIQQVSFIIGGMILVGVAFYAGFRFKIRSPSVMSVLHEEVKHRTLHTVTTLVLLVFFFLLVFNLAFEWLAIAIDAPLLFIALILYLWISIRKHHFKPESMLFKLGSVGERFYESFLKHFKYRETLMLGLGGLLVLHLLTDVGNFLLPYLTGLRDALYLPFLGPGHDSLWTLWSQNPSLSSLLVYFLNAVALLGFLVLPAWVWYVLYKKNAFVVKPWILAIFYSATSVFLINPSFVLSAIFKNPYLYGVDIQTRAITDAMLPSGTLIFIALLIGVIVYFLAREIKPFLTHVMILASQLFFGIYVYLFFISALDALRLTLLGLILHGQWFIALFFFFFLVITLLFYIGGFLLFQYELWVKNRLTIL